MLLDLLFLLRGDIWLVQLFYELLDLLVAFFVKLKALLLDKLFPSLKLLLMEALLFCQQGLDCGYGRWHRELFLERRRLVSSRCLPSDIIDKLDRGYPPNGLSLLDGKVSCILSTFYVLELDRGCHFVEVAVDADYFAKLREKAVDVTVVKLVLGHILNIDREPARINHVRLLRLRCLTPLHGSWLLQLRAC